MADWSELSLATLFKLDLPDTLHERAIHTASLNYDGDTNIGAGFVRLVGPNDAELFERFDGTDWQPVNLASSSSQSNSLTVSVSEAISLEPSPPSAPTNFSSISTAANTIYSFEALIHCVADPAATGDIFSVNVRVDNVDSLGNDYSMLMIGDNSSARSVTPTTFMTAEGGQFTAVNIKGSFATNENPGVLDVLMRRGSGAASCEVNGISWLKLTEIGDVNSGSTGTGSAGGGTSGGSGDLQPFTLMPAPVVTIMEGGETFIQNIGENATISEGGRLVTANADSQNGFAFGIDPLNSLGSVTIQVELVATANNGTELVGFTSHTGPLESSFGFNVFVHQFGGVQAGLDFVNLGRTFMPSDIITISINFATETVTMEGQSFTNLSSEFWSGDVRLFLSVNQLASLRIVSP